VQPEGQTVRQLINLVKEIYGTLSGQQPGLVWSNAHITDEFVLQSVANDWYNDLSNLIEDFGRGINRVNDL
jgi:hypothetical protein